eukprot:scaffold493675_cov18-Prasinocladus_malaysianus.AAC.1
MTGQPIACTLCMAIALLRESDAMKLATTRPINNGILLPGTHSCTHAIVILLNCKLKINNAFRHPGRSWGCYRSLLVLTLT